MLVLLFDIMGFGIVGGYLSKLCVTLPHMSIRARIVVAVALHEVNHAPDTKASSKSDNKGLQNAYCRIKKCHKVLLSCRVCGCPKKGIKNGGQFW